MHEFSGYSRFPAGWCPQRSPRRCCRAWSQGGGKPKRSRRKSQQQTGSRTGFAFQAQGINAGVGSAAGKPSSQNSACSSPRSRYSLHNQVGRWGDAEAGQRRVDHRFSVIMASRARFGRRCWSLPSCLEAPGIGWRQVVPIDAGMAVRLGMRERRVRAGILAGADHPHHRRQRGGPGGLSGSGPARNTRSTSPRCSPCRSMKLPIRRNCTSRPGCPEEVGDRRGQWRRRRRAPGHRYGSGPAARCSGTPLRHGPGAVR